MASLAFHAVLFLADRHELYTSESASAFWLIRELLWLVCTNKIARSGADTVVTDSSCYSGWDNPAWYVCMYFVYMTASGKENLCLLCLVIYDASAEFGTHNGNLFIWIEILLFRTTRWKYVIIWNSIQQNLSAVQIIDISWKPTMALIFRFN